MFFYEVYPVDFSKKLRKIGLLHGKSLASIHKLTLKNLRKIREFTINFFCSFALLEVRDSCMTFGH